MVTFTMMGSMEAEYVTAPGLSIDTTTFGLILNCPSSRSLNYMSNISKMVTDTILKSGSIEVE